MIAFVHHTYESGREGRHELWVGNVSGDTPRKLVDVKETDQLSGPVWSPDGQWIAYNRTWNTAEGSLHSAIEVTPTAGGPAKTLLAESSLPVSNTFFEWYAAFFNWYAATWSSDWRLLFVAAQGSKSAMEGGLWQVRTQAGTAQAVSKPERLTRWDDSCCANLTASSDGKRLAFVKYRAWVDDYIAELAPDGASVKAPRSLLRTQPQRGGPDSWTHDGQLLLFDSVQDGRREIFRRRPNDTVAERLVATTRDVCCAQMSPDGAWLLYLETDLVEVGQNPDLIWLMRRPINGGPAERVLKISGADLDGFRCRYNPKANSPCVLAIMEGEDLVFYSLDPIKGKGSLLGRLESWVSLGCAVGISRLMARG